MYRLVIAAVVGAALLVACGGDDGGGSSGDREGSPARRQPAATDGAFARIPQLVDEMRPSVVAVFASSAQGEGEGSGVIWDERGTVVTNNHVIQGAQRVRVQLATGERVDAEVRATDPRSDLAVLKVERDGLPAAEFADTLPAVGELAVALGNPLGFENSVTAGIVSGVDRSIPTGGSTPALVGLIQTDAAISPGNSGGALVDASGKVIGINVAYIPPQARAVSIGFAIPSPTVIDVVEQLLEDGEVEHAFMGVGLQALTPRIAERFGIDADGGAIVTAVADGAPAHAAGLRRGDVIVKIGDRPIRSVEDVFALLRDHAPSDRVRVEVLRGDERRTVNVELAQRPEPR